MFCTSAVARAPPASRRRAALSNAVPNWRLKTRPSYLLAAEKGTEPYDSW